MALKPATRQKKQSSVVSQNAFAGQAKRPSQKAVEAALGQSYALWKKIISDLKNELRLDDQEWNSSGLKYGWALRLQLKQRNIVYLGPRAGSFMMFISPTPPIPSVTVPMKASRTFRASVMMPNCESCFWASKTKTARWSSNLKL